jgi:DNA-binding LacI/PurR family transcriptional regulator
MSFLTSTSRWSFGALIYQIGVTAPVGADNVVGGYLATKHLLNLGRKHIVFMGDINMPEPKAAL